MTDLTKQWKKRTLRNGAYYIKMLGGDILPAFCNTEYILKQFQTMKGVYDDVAEVLAPVPTFEEWQKLNWYAGNAVEENQELKMKNARLKELLESALSWLPDSSKLRAGRYVQLQNLKRKINEVLK